MIAIEPVAELKPKIAHSVLAIPTSLISPDPDQPRKEFTPEYINGLAESIKAEGLLQPITVRKNPSEPGKYLIIMGECRWRAHCLAGIQSIPARVTLNRDDEASRFRAQVIENHARQSMTLRETANAAVRMKKLGDTDEAAAAALGESVNRVRIFQKMAGLSEQIWKLIVSGSLQQWLVERAIGSMPFEHVETLLMRCVDKDYKRAGAILYSYLDSMKQQSFELACEAAGVSAQKKVDTAKQVAIQVMLAANMIAGLNGSDRAKLGRVLAAEAAELIPATMQNRRGATFLAQVMKNIDARIDSV
jgi:ParB/RepB/Spo0J family partition protein